MYQKFDTNPKISFILGLCLSLIYSLILYDVVEQPFLIVGYVFLKTFTTFMLDDFTFKVLDKDYFTAGIWFELSPLFLLRKLILYIIKNL